jgi:hypothetical protein
MINRLRRGLRIPVGSGETAGFAVLESNKRIGFNLGPVDGSINRFVDAGAVVKKTASFTVLPQDSGKTFIFDSTTSVVATLPAASTATSGMKVRFVVEQLTASGGHAVSPAAADQIIGNGFTPADNKDAICSAASDRLGDMIELTCDGELGWYITGVIGTWAREA